MPKELDDELKSRYICFKENFKTEQKPENDESEIDDLKNTLGGQDRNCASLPFGKRYRVTNVEIHRTHSAAIYRGNIEISQVLF